MTAHPAADPALDEPPEARIDQVLTHALTSVLGRVEENDDSRFSDLGGDSLRAVRVLGACWRGLGVELPLDALKSGTRMGDFRRTLYAAVSGAADPPTAIATASTVAASGDPDADTTTAASPDSTTPTSAHTSAAAAAGTPDGGPQPSPSSLSSPSSPLTSREPDGKAGVIPRQRPGGEVRLPPGLEALVTFHRAEPANAAYNVPLTLRLEGTDAVPTPGQLRDALHELALRHSALRTVFTEEAGAVRARVRREPELDWGTEDLRGPTVAEAERRAEARVRELSVAPLDLTRTSLRARSLRLPGGSLLVLVLHHSVCDAWSLRVLVEDLLELCAARGGGARGGGARESEPPLGAVDVAAWERDRLTEARRAELAAFWRTTLDGVPDVLELPTDHPRPAVRTFRGARVPVRLEAGLVSALRARAAARDVTLFTVLATGCALTLRRYTGQDDLVLGFPVAGRVRPELDRVVGYLTKTVPLRVRLADRPDLDTLMREVHEDIARAQDHADLPLDAIADAAGARRAPGLPPLIQCALVLFADGRAPTELPGLTARTGDPGTGTSKFDLNWYLEEDDGALEGYVEFSTDLFEAATAERLHRHFVRLLTALAEADVSLPAARLPVLTDAERRRLVGGPEPERADGAENWLPVQRMFAREAAAHPDHEALRFEGGSLTYAQLDARSDTLADRLVARGLGAEDLVGVHIGRSPDQIAALLAVLKAGAAYLPLDPAYPAERLAYMARDSRLSAVLTSGEAPEFAAEAGVREIIDVTAVPHDAVAARPPEDGNAAREQACWAERLAYVIYTSGTTGRPKGVQITHRGLANVVTASRRDFDIGPDTRVLQVVSFNFDASVWEIFMALACGATLCLGPPDIARSERSAESVIKDLGVTLMYLPPALLSLVDPRAVPEVRVALTGGDLITPELRRRWTGRCRFFVAYGPTEGTIVQTWQEHTTEHSAALPIGRPFDGVRLYVLDAELDPVPVGVVGEVYVGGLAVSRGYRDRPGTTAGVYLPDPYAGRPGARMYRTGDRVRRLPGGELTFVGRTDHQVKIRGYRIEPAEVEAALLRCPGVEAAAVLAEPGPGGRPQLVGYVVTPPEEGDVGARLGELLRTTLPQHMVPGRIHRVPTVPLTANGKVDRAALPALAGLDDDSLARLLDQVEHLAPDEGKATS